MFNIDQKNLKNANLFAAGLALGTVGLKVLTSKDAKKYTLVSWQLAFALKKLY